MKVQKVYHIPVLNAVDEVADGAAQYRRQSDRAEHLIVSQLNEDQNNENERENGNRDEKDSLERLRSLAQKPECEAVVFGENEIQKTGNDRLRSAEIGSRENEIFRQLIKRKNQSA